MHLLILLSIVSLSQSIDLSTVHGIDELLVFVKGAGNQLSEASDQLNGVEIEGTKNYAEVIDNYLLKVPHTDEDGEKYQELKDLVEKIDEAWNDLGTKDTGDDDKTQLAAVAQTRDELYDFYVGNGTAKGLPRQIAEATEPYMCDITIPEQLRLAKVHQAVALSELRAFVLGLKAGEDNQKAVAKGILQLEEYILTSKIGFEQTDDTFRACDPPEHVRGETFGEFLGLFQGLVVNYGHTNLQPGTSDCGKSWKEIDESMIIKCYKRKDDTGWPAHCHRKTCSGRLFECIPATDVKACELDPKSDRRFSWARDENMGKMYGKFDSCDNGQEVSIVDSAASMASTICFTCLCICAEEASNSKAIRSVSLLPQFADIKKNMIVTGVRFQEKGKMFHIQIEESKLGALGEIIPGSSNWKKLDLVRYNPKEGIFQLRKGYRTERLVDTFDYKIFDRDSRGVHLDEVKTPYGEVIVGVSLAYDEDTDAVQIQILSWPFDFKTGKLKDPIRFKRKRKEYNWINWKNSPRKSKHYDNKRFEIGLETLDDPVLAKANKVLSDPNDKIQIRATGFRVDMGQHTIPYLTLQDVTFADKKSPLGGLELYYARGKGYGGFLGFRIRAYDLSYTFQDEMTQDDIDKYQADFDENLVQEIPVKNM